MSIFFQYDNDNGTNGNVLTTALSGYATMTGTDPTYDNGWSVNGSLCAEYALAGNFSIQSRAVPGGVLYWRRYYKWDATTPAPSASSAICAIYDTNGVIMGSVRVLSSGLVQLRSATATQVDVSTHAVTADEEWRINYHPVVGGTSTVQLFYGANVHGTTPDETLSGSNGTAGTGTITEYREGSIASSTWNFRADATVADDAAFAAPLGGGGPVTYQATGTVAAFSTLSGNPTIIPAGGGDPEPTPSLTTQMFIGAALATNGTGLLTNPARWSWAGFGYAYPGGNITPEGQGMRVNWSTSPAQPGNGVQAAAFFMDEAPLIPGHRIKVKVVVNVPEGSPDVGLVNLFTQDGDIVAVKGRDMELVMFLTWETGRNAGIGIRAVPGGAAGSVLIKRVNIVDVSSSAGEWYPIGGTVLPPPPPVDTTAPTTPGTPTDVITGSSVALSWTASTDNVAVTGYEVHRSASSGFTPSPSTLRTNAPSNTWTDNGVPVGTWYYKVIAFDAAGNKSAASAQDQAIVSAPVVTTIMAGISTQQNFGGLTGWDGYRAYTSSRLYSFSDMTGAGAGQTRPKFVAYSKQGAPFSGSYASILATCLNDLNAYYYTGGSSSQTHSSRWGIKLYWSNGNEMYDKGMLASQTPANIALFVESQRALYDACHYIDPTTGQRRFPDAYAGSNPVHSVATQTGNEVKPWLIPSARYHDFVMWSAYPPGRQGNGAGGIANETDPTFNWPSYDVSDRYDNELGYFLRPYMETNEARAQARIDTGNPNFEITVNIGEIGIASDPDDSTTRPYFAVKAWFGSAVTLSAQFGITTDYICYWDNALGAGEPHTILADEPPNSDHGGNNGASTSPSTALAFRDWDSYLELVGGTEPGSWSANPKGSWRFTGTQL